MLPTKPKHADRHWRLPHEICEALRAFALREDFTDVAAVRHLLREALKQRGYLPRPNSRSKK